MKKKRTTAIAAITVLYCTLGTGPLQAESHLSIHIDDLGAALALTTEPDRYYAAPAYDHHYDIYDTELLYVPLLGFYVAWASPWNVVFLDNRYYLYHHNSWYHANSRRGQWKTIRHHRLPRKIRQHHWAGIVHQRDRYYRQHSRHTWLKHPERRYRNEPRSHARQKPALDHRRPQKRDARVFEQQKRHDIGTRGIASRRNDSGDRKLFTKPQHQERRKARPMNDSRRSSSRDARIFTRRSSERHDRKQLSTSQRRENPAMRASDNSRRRSIRESRMISERNTGREKQRFSRTDRNDRKQENRQERRRDRRERD
ncbi:hypothetical protein INT08_03415 [Prosthecochloris sp. N3]|uniref:DUF3300 domain-containing protein n=1 Tax=Prosthecochloris ethylica TaxID=2743976 RepID=A0ABR9XQB4_9CHLB|nr:hypothetical protein [Prosthecochloris ethylica]MBF0585445.1 hypothetical protein [Prosthecochloris ethylica]MBF0636231.1 hypothetical protein [Prosthecochloris ethylica]NUK46675.1 hypothetical protein [Prosthecochloris ethylica]